MLTISRLRKKAVNDFDRKGAIYIICLVIQGKLWTYVGQTGDAWRRIQDGHLRSSYRSLSKRSFLYWLWEQADERWICLAASGEQVVPGPVLNVVEQWVATLFLALQPPELASNIPSNILATIPEESLQYGVGVREPLGEATPI